MDAKGDAPKTTGLTPPSTRCWRLSNWPAAACSKTLDTQDFKAGSRVTHAAALLADDPHDAREHDAERELDFARTDQIEAQLREIDAALQRLRQPGYGHCQTATAPSL